MPCINFNCDYRYPDVMTIGNGFWPAKWRLPQPKTARTSDAKQQTGRGTLETARILETLPRQLASLLTGNEQAVLTGAGCIASRFFYVDADAGLLRSSRSCFRMSRLLDDRRYRASPDFALEDCFRCLAASQLASGETSRRRGQSLE